MTHRIKFTQLLLLGAAYFTVGVGLNSTGAHSRQPVRETAVEQDARPSEATVEQWRDRKFGMFIHFGLYSLAGGMWNGKKIDNGYSEQILANGHLPPEEYAALAGKFNPGKFDPDAIVSLAKAAGMKYIVITAKHHDGFNLFRTRVTDYNVADATPYGRDIIKEIADACKRGHLAFGVYYSSIDWHHPGGNSYIEGNSNPLTPAQAAFNIAQLKELMSSYGPITEVWFDMGKPTLRQSRDFARTVHELQPQAMVSGRVWNHQGDFTVMGDNAEPSVAVEEPWESPASMYHETWGYRSWQVRGDVIGKTHEHITRLVRVVSAGGNYILNIGPAGDGGVVPFEAEVLRGIGAWLQLNGEAIYGTRPARFSRSLDFGYATMGRQKVYLFIQKMPSDGRLRLPGVVDTRFGTATVLGSAGVSLPVFTDADGAFIETKRNEVFGGDMVMPVVVVPFMGGLNVRPASVAPDDHGFVHLIDANGARFLRHDGYGYDDPPTVYKMHWDVGVGPGAYVASIHYRPAARASAINVIVDGHAYPVELDASGNTKLEIRRDVTASPYVMSVEMVPASPRARSDHLPVVLERIDLQPL